MIRRLLQNPGWRSRIQRLSDLMRQWPWIYPRGIARSAKDWIERSRQRKDWYDALRGDWREVVHAGGSQVFAPPPGIPDFMRPVFKQVATRIYPEASVCHLSCANLFGSKGMVLTRDNRVLSEYYHEFSVRSVRRVVYGRPFALARSRVRRVAESVGLLAAPQGLNYYHWLFDVLPRHELLGRWRGVIERYAVPRGLRPVHRETLRCLGVEESALLLLDEGERLRCESLFLPSLPASEGCSPPWVIAFLRERFLPWSQGTAGSGPKIYVARGAKTARPVANETQVVEVLSRRGFRVVDPGSMSFREQVATFRDARMIVAPHGAALSNAAFSTRAAVLELFSADYSRVDCYFTLCRQCGHAYDCSFDGRKAGPGKALGSIAVDIPALEEKVSRLERSLDA
jgi:hypothetical protein